MKVNLASDFPITDEAIQSATGKSFDDWYAAMEVQGIGIGRREMLNWIYNETGRGKDMWWPTTIWVEYERKHGIVNKKDGLLEGYNICCTKSIAAPASAVYQAWVADAADWLGAGPAIEGGPYSDADGNEGKWLRLRPDKDVRFEWRSAGVVTATLVDATFTEKAGKTAIAVMHTRIQTRDEADGLRSAWTDALNRLKAKLEV